MSSTETLDLLNHLHVIHYRSLPMYLSSARPWSAYGQDDSLKTLDRIIADQKAITDRIGGMILDLGGAVDNGHFPMYFTAWHDVSLTYLTKVMIERQQREIVVIEKLVDGLRLVPLAQSLAQESLGEAKAHLDMLLESQQQPAAI